MAGILVMITSTAGATSPSTVELVNAAAYGFSISPSSADAALTIDSDGFLYLIENGVTTQLFQWCTPVANTNLFEAFATLVDGSNSLTSGTLNTWLTLGTDRSWTLQQVGVGSRYSSINIGIRAIAAGEILASATYDLSATVE